MTGRDAQSRVWPPLSDDRYRQEAVDAVGVELADRLAGIRLMVFDADGVLTSGNLIYGAAGETLKEFHAHDGLGLVLARVAGIRRAVLTGRNSRIVERRCRELRFDVVKLGRFDKVAALEEILAETDCGFEETLYMGDDLIDLPPMFRVGCAVTVPDAPAELREFCRHVTRRRGGQGAVREIVDLVLKSSGLYRRALEDLGRKDAQPTRAELSSDDDKETWS